MKKALYDVLYWFSDVYVYFLYSLVYNGMSFLLSEVILQFKVHATSFSWTLPYK